jgi:hypothetical protein
MDLKNLKTGAMLWLEDGSVVEVLTPSADGASVRIKYIEAPFADALLGTEADCTDYDIISYADSGDRADSSGL